MALTLHQVKPWVAEPLLPNLRLVWRVLISTRSLKFTGRFLESHTEQTAEVPANQLASSLTYKTYKSRFVNSSRCNITNFGLLEGRRACSEIGNRMKHYEP